MEERIQHLFDIQKSDLHSLEEQGFTDICIIKKLVSNLAVPKGFSITYWCDSNVGHINVLLEESGNYTLSIKDIIIQENVEIHKVKETLDQYDIRILPNNPFVIVEKLKGRNTHDKESL